MGRLAILLGCLLIAEAQSVLGKDFFDLHLDAEKPGESELVVRIVLNHPASEDAFIAEATIFWTLPEGTGMSVPVHPVTEKVLAAKIAGPFSEGKHRLLTSIAVRNEEGFVEAFHEREYNVLMPSMVVTMKPMRSFSSSLKEQAAASGAMHAGGEKEERKSFSTMTWVGITLGMMGLGVMLIVVFARMGVMPTIEGVLRSSRIGGTVLRSKSAERAVEAAMLEKTHAHLPTEAAIEATEELIETAEKPSPAEPEPVDLEKLNF